MAFFFFFYRKALQDSTVVSISCPEFYKTGMRVKLLPRLAARQTSRKLIHLEFADTTKLPQVGLAPLSLFHTETICPVSTFQPHSARHNESLVVSVTLCDIKVPHRSVCTRCDALLAVERTCNVALKGIYKCKYLSMDFAR